MKTYETSGRLYYTRTKYFLTVDGALPTRLAIRRCRSAALRFGSLLNSRSSNPNSGGKMKARKSKVGGPRKGAGRPPGTGPGPSPDARWNRLTILLRDPELAKLRQLAKKRDLPAGTVAYELFAQSLRRAR